MLVILLAGVGGIYFVSRANPPYAQAPASAIATTSAIASSTTAGTANVAAVSSSSPVPTPIPTQAATSTVDCASLPRSEPPANTTGITNGPILSFNFDDGFESSYQNALPIINGAGFPTTQYIISGNLAKPDRVSAAQVLAMQAAGNEIGAHTRTHPYLSRIPVEQMRREICGSRADLMKLGILTTTFAYPEGDFSPAVEQVAAEAGFAAARDTKGGLNNDGTPRLLLHSYQVTAPTTFAQVKNAINQAIQYKEWLILVFHRTDDPGNSISSSHELIQQIVDYVKQVQIPVVTNAQGLSILPYITGTQNSIRDLSATTTSP